MRSHVSRTMPLRLQKYIGKKINLSSTQRIHSAFSFGFVIVRSIRDIKTAKYWHKSYTSIRTLYPHTPIVIIDDKSNPCFINIKAEKALTNCQIIQSEYPGCGEMLGYYYFWKNRWFPKAVVIHDSVFLRRPIDFASCRNVRFIWDISTHQHDDVELETELVSKIGGPYAELYEKKEEWMGCFGVMSVIDHDFLVQISAIFDIIREVRTRRHRSCMERIFAVACFHHYPELMTNVSLMGDILTCPFGWGYSFTQYQREEKRRPFPDFVKVWTGR